MEGLLQMRSRPYFDELSPEGQAQRRQDVYSGLLSSPKYGAMMLPASGVTEMMGLMADPEGEGYLPSTMDLLREGRFGDVGYQLLGGLGDALYAGAAVVPPLAIPAAGAKAARAGRLATQGESLGLLSEAERVKQVKELPYFGTEEFPAETLLGEEIIFIPADRMATGFVYEGLAEAPISQPRGLRGGQLFGTTKESVEQGLGFASLDEAIAKRISQSGAKYGIIGAMDAASQLSNRDMANIVAQQVQAYIREGKIPNQNISKLTNLIKSRGLKSKQTLDKAKAEGRKAGSGVSDTAKLANIPDIDSPEIFDWLDSQTFETRKQFAKTLNQVGSRNLGAPSIDRILSETIDPMQAGALPLQGNVLVRLTGEAPIDVAKEGGIPHPSYPIGILGEPVAQIKYGVRGEDLFSEKVAEWLEGGGNVSRLQRFMNMKLPQTTITPEKLQIFPTGEPNAITSARQARLLVDFMNSNWRKTTEPVNQGGVGVAEILTSYENNRLSETLTPYTKKELTDGAKDGSLVFYGLGRENQGKIYFGLKKNTDYKDLYGIDNPKLTPNEVGIVGVMNNELGQAGASLGVPTSMLKAIEEGATVLDAYAVPSKNNPKGFLPEYYGQFNFEEVERIPFDEKYVRNPKFGGSEKKYKALINQWKKSGWDESMGNPDLVIMKWKGEDETRTTTVRDYVEQNKGRFGRETAGLVSGARRGFGGRSSESLQAQQQSSGTSIGSGDRGGLLGDGGGLSSRFSRAIGEIPSLTTTEQRALGLLE